ncbi:MAG: SAM-dependent methyltransferase [Rhodocyclaceae bacterium]|nr:SAM-dependent methyltransferase [Rhodocyclaceae bacterium]
MPEKHEIRPGQSLELLKELHILTREGRLNQDSRRKLKQVYHLYHFIEPLLEEVLAKEGAVHLVDVGAGKSYLGFILYDLFFKARPEACVVIGIETRAELVTKARELAARLGFAGMRFLDRPIAAALEAPELPARIDIVTALHACDTATDDAIRFALHRRAQFVVLVPCCQAEVAAWLRKRKGEALAQPLAELWRHPLHTREFASLVTNVLRCLQLEAHGYQVSVTELVGWEHSLKNELILARRTGRPQRHRGERLKAILAFLGLQDDLAERFFLPRSDRSYDDR